jgi:choline kinase
MVPFRGKPLLEHLVGTLRRCGISDIVVVRGPLGDKITYTDLRYVDDLDGHNMLHSLFKAEHELTGDLVVTYADILYEDAVLWQLLAASGDISVAVDLDWKRYFSERAPDPYSIAESLVINNGAIQLVGTPINRPEDVQGQYIGLLKLTGDGTSQLRQCYWKYRSERWGKPWQQARQFENAYITDILQQLIDDGMSVRPACFRGGWVEIDTAADYERLLELDRKSTLPEFLRC